MSENSNAAETMQVKSSAIPESAAHSYAGETLASGHGNLNISTVVGYSSRIAKYDTETSIIHWLAGLRRHPEGCSLAFDFHLDSESHIVSVTDAERVPQDMWFVGDIHGDFLALTGIIALIDKTTPNATIVFLGDLFDRHEFGFEVVMLVFSLVRNRPGKIMWIAGNHDLGLMFRDGRFISDCEPSDFAVFLNSKPELKEFGIALCRFIQCLPWALFLPDGLVCFHGGVPHDDMLSKLNAPADLSISCMRDDFVWNRIHPSAPKKLVNRTARGCELGCENIKAFFRKASALLDIPMERLVCGHQHPDKTGNGYELLKNDGVPGLILNSSVFSENMFKPGWITPYIARYRANCLPERVPVMIDIADAESYYRGKDIFKPIKCETPTIPSALPGKSGGNGKENTAGVIIPSVAEKENTLVVVSGSEKTPVCGDEVRFPAVSADGKNAMASQVVEASAILAETAEPSEHPPREKQEQ